MYSIAADEEGRRYGDWGVGVFILGFFPLGLLLEVRATDGLEMGMLHFSKSQVACVYIGRTIMRSYMR